MPAFAYAALVLVFTLGFVRPAQAAPLTDYQQKMFDEVKAGMDSVNQSLADARAKLEAGDAGGASTAYNTAVRNYNSNVRRIGQLPTGNEAVAGLKKDAAATAATLKEFAAALKAGPPAKAPASGGPAAMPATAPAAPAGNVKLDYRQVEALKNARFYLTEVEPREARITELTKGKLDAEAIGEALNHMKFVHQRMGFAVKVLNDLPGGNAEVAAESKRYNDLLARLVTAQTAIEKAAPDADMQIAALEKQMNDDLAMVESWGQSLGNPQALFADRPNDAIAAVGQLPQMRQAIDAMTQRWTARATEKPNDKTAADMVRKVKFVNGQLADLETYAKGLATSLPQAIGKDLGEVGKMIETAVTEKRPLYFGPDSGIAQQLKSAEQKVTMLGAIDAAAAAEAEKSLASMRAKSTAAQKTLAADIINNNKKPQEKYAGADVEQLRQLVVAHWKESNPDLPIVAVVFNTPGWTRTTRWDWSKGNQGFYKVDYDHIQPKLFYKLNDTQAVEMPVEVYKDYMKESRIVVKPWAVEAEPPVTRTYLLTNLK